MTPTTTILAIDPSINHIGWAVGDVKHGAIEPEIKAYGTLHMKSGKLTPILQRLGEIETKVQELITSCDDIDLCIYEQPNSWTRGKKNVKSLGLLQRAIGCIIETVSGNRIPLKAVPVDEWKGNAPKVNKRQFEALYGDRPSSEHARDAVMMLRWYVNNERIQGMIEER